MSSQLLFFQAEVVSLGDPFLTFSKSELLKVKTC